MPHTHTHSLMNFADALLPIAPPKSCPHQPLLTIQSGPTSQQGFIRFFISTYFMWFMWAPQAFLLFSTNNGVEREGSLSTPLLFFGSSFPHQSLIFVPSLFSSATLLQVPNFANQRKTSFPSSLSRFLFPCPFHIIHFYTLLFFIVNSPREISFLLLFRHFSR